MDSAQNEFATNLYSIKEVDQDSLKAAMERCASNPSAENIWILSRFIQIAPAPLIKQNIDKLSKLTVPNRTKMLSASFASSHLICRSDEIGQTDSYKWVKSMPWPINPLYASYIYNIISRPAFGSSLPILWNLLQSSNLEIQKHAASAIAKCAKSPANFLRRVLATFSPDPPPDVQKLDIQNQTPTLVRGLILIAGCLTQHQINSFEYTKPLLSVIGITPTNKAEKEAAMLAQELMARIMIQQPSAFHTTDFYTPALVQIKNNNFSVDFLKAILSVFGLSCIRKFITPLIPRWIDGIRNSIQYLEAIAPYSGYLVPSLQVEIHSALINHLEKKPYDRKLIEVISIFMQNSNPAQSPLLSKFLDMLSKYHGECNSLAYIHPLVEPKTSPVAHPQRELMVVPQIEMRDSFVQVEAPKRNIIIQCDVRRDIRPAVAPKVGFVAPSAAKNVEKPSFISAAEKLAAKEDKKPDVDIDIDIDINMDGPDSDEE